VSLVTMTALDFRARLLGGLTEALREHPYAEVTVADVVRCAKTSKRTFYEHFADKDECLVALLTRSNIELREAIAEAVDPQAAWRTQIRQGVRALLAQVHDQPHLFLNGFRSVHALDQGRQLIREGMATFVDLLRTLGDTPELQRAGVAAPTRELAIMVFGGVRELIVDALEEGRDPADLLEPVTDALTALLGPRA
jgi:AcrR family transcriptional regulator